jgi:hypothetical protein
MVLDLLMWALFASWIIASIRIVPPYHGEIVFFLGKSWGKIYEGWKFVPALVMNVSKPISLGPRPTTSNEGGGERKIELLTKDGSIIVEWSARWTPDLEIPDKFHRPSMFTAQTVDNIHHGLQEAIDSNLGVIAGGMNSEDFVKNKGSVDLFINSVLKLSKPAHLLHNDKTFFAGKEFQSSQCTDADCGFEAASAQEAEDIIKFYKTHERWIRALHKDERNHEKLRSPVEEQFGIDVIEFNSEVRQPPEQEESRRQRLQAKQTSDTLVEAFASMEHLINIGVSPDEAARMVERHSLSERANAKHVVFSGLGGGSGEKSGEKGSDLTRTVIGATIAAQQAAGQTPGASAANTNQPKKK